MKIITEVCCGSVTDAINAARGGADRVELCSCIPYGGLSPSLGALKYVKQNTAVKVVAMCRPREGGFFYNAHERKTLLYDAVAFAEQGAEGIVFGCLRENGEIDLDFAEAVVRLVRGVDIVFHKAFDVAVGSKVANAKALSDIGVTRILTSGGAKTALEGADIIGELVRTVGGIQIIAGGGVRSHNVRELVERSGCRQVHTSAFVPVMDSTALLNPSVSFSPKTLTADGEFSRISSDTVRDFVKITSSL